MSERHDTLTAMRASARRILDECKMTTLKAETKRTIVLEAQTIEMFATALMNEEANSDA